jgi:hypothetical protein
MTNYYILKRACAAITTSLEILTSGTPRRKQFPQFGTYLRQIQRQPEAQSQCGQRFRDKAPADKM